MMLNLRIIQIILKMMALILLYATLSACDNKPPPFLWTPSSDEWSSLSVDEQKISSSLDTWLEQAPFDDLWDPYSGVESGHFVMTNASTIFPFLGKWFSQYGKVESYGAFRKHDHVLYADPEWYGTVLVWGAIKQRPSPFYLDDFNMESISSMTPGSDLISSNMRTSSVRFSTTKTFSETPEERQAVLWGFRGMMGTSFLVGFLDRGNLLFLVAFPCHSSIKETCVKKLGDVSRSLSLDVPAWESLTVEGLEKKEHDFFFKVKKHELFEPTTINVTMNGHPFKLETITNQEEKAVFSYKKDSGEVRVTVHKPKEISNKKLDGDTVEEYLEDEFSENPQYRIGYKLSYNSDGKKAYFKEEINGNVHSVTAYALVEYNLVLQIVYEFPVGDKDSRLAAERFVSLIDFK